MPDNFDNRRNWWCQPCPPCRCRDDCRDDRWDDRNRRDRDDRRNDMDRRDRDDRRRY